MVGVQKWGAGPGPSIHCSASFQPSEVRDLVLWISVSLAPAICAHGSLVDDN